MLSIDYYVLNSNSKTEGMALDEKLLVGGSRKDCVGYSDASNGFNVLRELPPPPPSHL